MKKTFTIEGEKIFDIHSFYSEINRIFMGNEDWKIATSLDALNDLLYGGFGEIRGSEDVKIIWDNSEKNRNDLGKEATLKFYEEKLKSPEIFNEQFIKQKIIELQSGSGKTYFEIILEIFDDHQNIALQLQ